MIAFLYAMIIVLTISNVSLWLTCMGLKKMFIDLCYKTIELGKCLLDGEVGESE